jgi:hypothetical protein
VYFPQKCHFQVISNILKSLSSNENTSYIIFNVFLIALDSFQILSNVSMIYQVYYCISSFKNFNVNLSNHLLQWKLNENYILKWFSLAKLDLMIINMFWRACNHVMCNQLHNRGLIIDIQKFMTISCSLSICLVMFFIVQEFNCYINACLKFLWMMTSSHCKVFVQLTQMNINNFLGWLFWTHDKKKIINLCKLQQ